MREVEVMESISVVVPCDVGGIIQFRVRGESTGAQIIDCFVILSVVSSVVCEVVLECQPQSIYKKLTFHQKLIIGVEAHGGFIKLF